MLFSSYESYFSRVTRLFFRNEHISQLSIGSDRPQSRACTTPYSVAASSALDNSCDLSSPRSSLRHCSESWRQVVSESLDQAGT